MKEIDQYRIELDSNDIEKIVENWASKQLSEKGYKLDYCRNESEQPFPDMSYRGVKEI